MNKAYIRGVLNDYNIPHEDAKDDQRAILLKTDTLHRLVIMKLLAAGVRDITAVNNDLLANFVIEY
jgi:hypothetical protein